MEPKQKAVQVIQSAIDRACNNLSRADYRAVLEEIETECEVRRDALDDDDRRDADEG